MKFLKSKKGMTVVEIVVALAILGLVSVGFIGFFTDSFKFQMRNQQTVSIQKVAEETMEKLKNNKGKNVIIGSDELDITPIVEGNTKLLSDDYYTYRITVNDINDVDKGSTFYNITIEVISKDNTKIVGSISSTVQVNDDNAGDGEAKENISVKYWNEDILFKEETVIRGEYFITLQNNVAFI